MAWFNEQDTPDLPTDDRSFIIATSNLLQRFDYDLPPLVVRKMLVEGEPTVDWWSIPRVYKDFAMHEFAEGESWPTTNNAIVKQRRMDEKQAGFVDHYSLVADQRAHSIIDSLDGTIKNASEYGPVSAWASYTYKGQDVTEEPETDEVDNNIHVKQENENIWDIGRHYNIPVAALIAENDIEDPRHIPVGTELYLPTQLIAKKDDRAIHYEVLTPARPMHIARPGGAKKWSFGGVTKWEDLYSTGRLYPDNHNVMIVAVAHVPIGEDTAAYYMDHVSFGDYETTGMVRYTNGFNWQHLAEGHTDTGTPPVPTSTLEQVVADAMAEEDRPELAPEPADELIIRPAPVSYKDTFTFLNEAHTPEIYLFNEALTVIEMDGKLDSKRVGKNDGVNIIGTFERDGVTYGRPAVKGYWYAVPMDKLTSEETVYNTDIDLPSRVAIRGHLSASERRLVLIAKTAGHYRRLAGLIKNKQRSN